MHITEVSIVETVLNNSCVYMQSRKHLMRPFCEGETRVLVCTDLASRGIDYDKVHVLTNVEWCQPTCTCNVIHRKR